MAKSRNRKKPPRSSIQTPRVDAVPVPTRRKKRTAAARPPAELPDPIVTYEI